MEIIITPTFSDFFEGPEPDLAELIKDIPSMTIISILSWMNAELYLHHDKPVQIRIFEFLIANQDEKTKQQIIRKIYLKIDGNENNSVEFFTTLYNLEFIHYELINHRDFKLEDTSPEQELTFLKAYFVIVSKATNKYIEAYNTNAVINADYFHKNIWPTLIDQFEVSHPVDPVVGMIKGIALLDSLEFNSSYTSYVKDFLKRNGAKTSWNYIFDLMNLLQLSWQNNEKDKFRLFTLPSSMRFNSLLRSLELDRGAYRKEFSDGKKNFSGLKDKPLIKTDEDNYIVLNWDFISNKLYNGLVFDFYKNSGIKNRFKNLRDFKRYISEDISEKYLFRKIIKQCIFQEHAILLFDERTTEGFPDAYFRKGKYIFLIEIKDSFFPAKSMSSFSYSSIKAVIDAKYNTDKKGTGQIISQLKVLKSKPFEKESYAMLKLKPRNLVIYPIIIYTDRNFSMPGINYYLKEELNKRIKQSKLKNEFEKIMDLTFIDLSFLISRVDVFGNKKVNLKVLIDDYHNHITNWIKKDKRERSVENLSFINENFETVIAQKYPEIKKKREGYIKTIVETLELTNNLD